MQLTTKQLAGLQVGANIAMGKPGVSDPVQFKQSYQPVTVVSKDSDHIIVKTASGFTRTFDIRGQGICVKSSGSVLMRPVDIEAELGKNNPLRQALIRQFM